VSPSAAACTVRPAPFSECADTQGRTLVPAATCHSTPLVVVVPRWDTRTAGTRETDREILPRVRRQQTFALASGCRPATIRGVRSRQARKEDVASVHMSPMHCERTVRTLCQAEEGSVYWDTVRCGVMSRVKSVTVPRLKRDQLEVGVGCPGGAAARRHLTPRRRLWPNKICSPRHRMLLNSAPRVQNAFDDVEGNVRHGRVTRYDLVVLSTR
jgi:hypothetical protein